MPPYASLDDVVARLGALERQLRARADRRSVFATLYGVVSTELRDRVARRAFRDSAWVQRHAVAAANLYREALELYDAGRRDDVPPAWRIAFDAAASQRTLVLQDLLLGVNAHVNHDCPVALDRVSIDPDREGRRRDHDAASAVLAAATERATQRLAALYASGPGADAASAAQLDALLALFSLPLARDSAWESAVALANARTPGERALTARATAARAGVLGRLLLAPAGDAALLAAGQNVERGSTWLNLLSAAVNDLT